MKKVILPLELISRPTGLNHLYQTLQNVAHEQIPNIAQTNDPLALEEISGWLLKQSK